MTPFLAALQKAQGEKLTRRDAKPTPGPGEWVYDRPKGMGPISRPEPLPDGPLDLVDVKDRIRYEGLGFCISSLIPHNRIADEQLSKKWYKAWNAMREVAVYLEEIE